MPRFRLRYQSTHLELPLGEFSIGRSSKCNLSISDEVASRRHAMLHVGPTSVFLEDLNSRNGVVVNGAVVQNRCRLTHMDRVYVGSQELVLIDAAKMTDQQDTAPHVLCNACGAVNGTAKRHCGECGKRLLSRAGDTYKDPRPRRSDPPARWDDPEETGTVKTRDVIGGIASKAIIMGRYDEAERMLLPHLHDVLERALRQQPLDNGKDDDPDTVFADAVHHGLELAKGLHDPRWIDWVFQIHMATGRLMCAETIEMLHSLVRMQEYKQRKYAAPYLRAIKDQAHAYDPAERFLARRLEGLSQIILA
ncbi:MAG: FHA domain-containing protein [Myxococcales bacterium]|nr:FHA domain-containing protein [Deltaproteobacteria bacterium]NNE20490.1 FHA domain-containing protein [Myxococcales bacterium]